MKAIGKKIKVLRQKKDWTLAELAKHSGVALSSLSRMETGKMTGTLESHLRIARALGVRVAELYVDIDPVGTAPEIHRGSEKNNALSEAAGVQLTLLVDGGLRKKMFPILVSLARAKSTKLQRDAGEAEKFLYVAKGDLEVELGRDVVTLSAGDALYFQANLPHRLKNVGSSNALCLSISSPPSL